MIFTALETDIVRNLQSGGFDANGQPPEHAVSNGDGTPCRHCLKDIPQGASMLVLAHRPFPRRQPYAETGPIFLCAEPCTRGGGTDLPEILQTSPDYLVKGYCTKDRIVYGTGAIVAQTTLVDHARMLLDDPRLAYLHVRSARNNCYQLRIDRSQEHGLAP